PVPAGRMQGSAWPPRPLSWAARADCGFSRCGPPAGARWPVGVVGVVPLSRCRRQIDYTSGAYRSMIAARTCWSPPCARLTRSVTGTPPGDRACLSGHGHEVLDALKAAEVDDRIRYLKPICGWVRRVLPEAGRAS